MTSRDTYDIEQAEQEAQELYDDHMDRMAEDHLLRAEELARRAKSEAYMMPYVERFREIAAWHAQLQVEFERSLLGLAPEPF